MRIWIFVHEWPIVKIVLLKVHLTFDDENYMFFGQQNIYKKTWFKSEELLDTSDDMLTHWIEILLKVVEVNKMFHSLKCVYVLSHPKRWYKIYQNWIFFYVNEFI